MKKSSDAERAATVLPASKATTVAIETDEKDRMVKIVISVRGKAHMALAQPKHQLRLRQNVEQLVDGVLSSPRPTASIKKLASRVITQPATRTKEPNSTIGVTSSEYLWEEIRSQAVERSEPLAVVARDLFERGLSALEERLWNEPSGLVIAEYKAMYSEYRSDQTKQWSLRPTRRRYLKAVILAKEYGISQSQLACVCIATSLCAVASA